MKLRPVPEPIRPAVDRLVREFGSDLCRIVLFGSRARGDHRPDSDWDLLVVLDGSGMDLGSPENRIAVRLRAASSADGLPEEIDVIPTCVSDIERTVHVRGKACRDAVLEGTVLYESPDAPPWSSWTELAHKRGGPTIDPEIGGSVREKMGKARDKLLLIVETRQPSMIAYSAQQVAEQALKAAQTAQGGDYSHGHDLDKLRNNLRGTDWTVVQEFPDLKELTGWYTAGAYHEDLEKRPLRQATPEDAARAVDRARTLFTSVCSDLRRKGFEVEFPLGVHLTAEERRSESLRLVEESEEALDYARSDLEADRLLRSVKRSRWAIDQAVGAMAIERHGTVIGITLRERMAWVSDPGPDPATIDLLARTETVASESDARRTIGVAEKYVRETSALSEPEPPESEKDRRTVPSARDRLRFARLAKQMDAIEAQEGLRAPRSLAESLAATPDPADLPFADLEAWHAEELREHLWEKRKWREAERERRQRSSN